MLRKIIIVSGLIVLILIIGFTILKERKIPEESPEGEQVPYGTGQLPKKQEQEEGGISFEEKQLIETWILESNLNQYGDSKDTVYIGGTPLFNEMTGERIDKYEYILRNHPERPWKK